MNEPTDLEALDNDLTLLVERRETILADLKRLDERYVGRHLGFFARRRWDNLIAEYEAICKAIDKSITTPR